MTTPAKQRRFRLQLSLRMLLVLMAVIGVVLAVYRWPWVEVLSSNVVGAYPFNPYEKTNFLFETRTTYRRNWRAQPVENGLKQTWIDGRLWEEMYFYEGELNGAWRVFNRAGQLTVEGNHRDNKLSGPYRAGDGTNWSWAGSFRDDLPHGTWRTPEWGHAGFPIDLPNFQYQLQESGGNLGSGGKLSQIICESNWHHGQRQGPMSWKAVDGEVLNVAHYDNDQFVRWNGEPIVEQFRAWLLSAEVNDPSLSSVLLADFGLVNLEAPDIPADLWRRFPGSWETDGALRLDMRLRLKTSNQAAIHLMVHLDQPAIVDYDWLRAATYTNAVPALCEFAAIEGYGFQYRYGALWLVSRVDPPPPFVDPTGVERIQFPPGSQEALEWDEQIDVREGGEIGVGCVHRLLMGTKLEYLVEGVDRSTLPETLAANDIVFRRSRRHALGYVLYRSGYRCELQNGQLAFRPRPNRTELERECRPLELTPSPTR